MPSPAQVASARRRAQTLMTSTVHIYTSTMVDIPGQIQPQENRETRYRGPGRLKFPGYTVSERDAGGQAFSRQDGVLSIPVGTGADISIGDHAEVEASANDDEPVGKRIRITGLGPQTFSASARYPVELIA